jgi:hypothetical protein
VIQHRWLEVREVAARRDENVRRREEDEWQLLGDDRLHAVVHGFALARIQRRELLLHQSIDLGLPTA